MRWSAVALNGEGVRKLRVCATIGLTLAGAGVALAACGPSVVRLGDDEPDASVPEVGVLVDASSLDGMGPVEASRETDAGDGTDASHATDASDASDAGGANDAGHAGDAGDASDAGDAGDATPPCPSTAPAAGAPCSPVGRTCEYGADPTPACNQIATCTASGWTYGPPTCPSGCASTCPSGTCPVAYLTTASPTAASVCSAPGLVCSFPQGTCACSSNAASSASTDAGLHWTCIAAEAGCPDPRPDLGTPCTGSTTCDYAACSGGIEIVRKSGVWESVAAVPCP